MTAYYNEIDPKAAAWLRELIKQNLIAPGDVDERSIEDVKPEDLAGYTQCHFFAGIGVWSYALRQAGWPDDKPVWTGSCPCQPFSSAGKGKGFDDERHLWPAFHWLISQCRPDKVFGEQVAGKDGETWFDHVSTDLEGENYACGAVTFPACSIGAPYQRQRLYWAASYELANHTGDRQCGEGAGSSTEKGRAQKPKPAGQLPDGSKRRSITGTLARCSGGRCKRGEPGDKAGKKRETASPRENEGLRKPEYGDDRYLYADPGPTNGFWRDVDWIYCRDGKWRPVEPGTFPLAHGSTERVGRLCGYGNAIVAKQAKIFIEIAMGIS